MDYSKTTKRKCNRCGIVYRIDEFYTVYYKARGKTYRRGHCKHCDNESTRRNYEKHREKILAQCKEKYARDPWTIRLRALLDRCKIGYVGVKDLQRLVEESEGLCSYCGEEFGDAWTFDHAQPISKGGTNDPENLRVCCLSCNSKKKDVTEAEFRLKTTGVPF